MSYVIKHPNPWTLFVSRIHLPTNAVAGDWEQMSDDELGRWIAEQSGWVPDETARLAHEAISAPTPPPHRVSKDTIISRVLAAGKLPNVMAALASQPPEQQFLWNNSLWFWNTNPTLRGLCAAPGIDMDPDVILARDEFLL